MFEFILLIFSSLGLWPAVLQLFYSAKSYQYLSVVSWLCKARLCLDVFQGPRGTPGLSGPPGASGREVSEFSPSHICRKKTTGSIKECHPLWMNKYNVSQLLDTNPHQLRWV